MELVKPKGWGEFLYKDLLNERLALVLVREHFGEPPKYSLLLYHWVADTETNAKRADLPFLFDTREEADKAASDLEAVFSAWPTDLRLAKESLIGRVFMREES